MGGEGVGGSIIVNKIEKAEVRGSHTCGYYAPAMTMVWALSVTQLFVFTLSILPYSIIVQLLNWYSLAISLHLLSMLI